ncbi:hypothetical protein D917_01165 [Trichinella nativa]|uniref:Uncharacterized protein n=1 Tax=Trichinella nativa TaxID=6335 RepID=A0A1Y3EZU8_9BILA|nr:hypothetical protein D917_01165 [Trichinella nativa]
MKKQSNCMENGDVHLAESAVATGCLSDLPDIEFHWTKIEDCQCDSKKCDCHHSTGCSLNRFIPTFTKQLNITKLIDFIAKHAFLTASYSIMRFFKRKYCCNQRKTRTKLYF